MSLDIRDVFVNYGKVEVLKGLSLQIEEGQISVLLGANGAGKSTLLNAISGLVRLRKGNIRFRENRIDEMSPDRIVAMGVIQIPQGRRLFGPMTVIENLKLGAYSRTNTKDVAHDMEDIFERFPRLRERRKLKSSLLSGGEQQMLAIARGLLAKPKLFLMDEPSEGLAPLIVGELASIIRRINQDGLTIVLVEHNLSLGLELAHRVHVVEDGRISFQAESSDLTGVEYAKKIYLGGEAKGARR